MPVDKRQDERLRVRFEVKLASGVDSREGMLVDISRRGAQVLTADANLQPDREVRVLVLRRAGQPVELAGRVVWSNAERFALSFDGLSERSQRWLASFLDEEGTALR